ncbi:PorP/SprF family type IX secretion system membrane protein [Hymenobacter properus]|uniref:PorP/SprF family type IX secretion system membrane protein n=1 Tax=Hymenobacter properus TaxID=2791026 RepID=A0A931BKA1_9BACT|nr:PorP/SprF family type IX secretion system membrane protein [Hymenobacter properus]MBF9143021.1 PorP/SprF family type IX secretion system membrane protein [Hymenobacter properus]MBR7721829.1 PorP/SprF family type IX secretion system membrane protein [Microvirga sp. SRT04]
MPKRFSSLFLPAKRGLAPALLLGTALGAHGQDVYFSQPYATRLHTNPAFTGLVDDYSVTLSYRNQLPLLAGSFVTAQAAADVRLNQPGQHHALGLLINQDRTGAIGYTRFEVGGLYAYHTRIKEKLALSGGLRASYGRQRVGYDNFVFGDQIREDGSVAGPSAESLDFPPVNYFSVGTGAVLYSEQFWLSLAGQHLNQPSLGFRKQSELPLLLNLSGGYKFFKVKPGPGVATREVSYTPVAAYTRQGGSQRVETGIYFTASPVTLGAVYRNIYVPGSVGSQHVLAVVAGVQAGGLRLGYSYDVGLSRLSADLGGAHEVTLALRAFDRLENAHRRLKKRVYPAAPCPTF